MKLNELQQLPPSLDVSQTLMDAQPGIVAEDYRALKRTALQQLGDLARQSARADGG